MAVTTLQVEGPISVVPNANIWPLGAEVFYVATAAQQAAFGKASKGFRDRLYPTVEDALSACTTARGDKIQVLEGYTASISAADKWSNLGSKTQVEIVGCGSGLNRPTLTWTAAAATMLFDQDGFKVRGMNMYLAGPQAAGTAQTTAAPITITGAGCELTDCDIWWGFDADQIVAIGITTTAAADNLKFNRNRCYAETAAVPTTTFLRLTGTDNLEIDGTFVIGPGSTVATAAPVQMLTTASLKANIKNSTFQNTLASSTVSFTAMAGCTGSVTASNFGVLAAGNGLTTGSGLQVNGSYTAVAGAAGVATTG